VSPPSVTLWADPLTDFGALAGDAARDAVFGVACDGSVAACFRNSSESPVEERGIGIFPKSRFQEPADYSIFSWENGKVRRLEVHGETVAVHHVQVLRDGILLAGARCRWRPEGPEKNAVLYGWDGHERARLVLGDGIEDLRAAPDGTIWASYFDEGVFGNYGWGNPGPDPVGASGLVAFDPSGGIRFSFDPGAAGTDSICDAYALNVTGTGEAWVYFYTEFPLVRIAGGRYRTWPLGIGGAHALAVRPGKALLYGDYDRPGLGRLVDLSEDGRAEVAAEAVIEDPDGRSLAGARARGAGGFLYLFEKGRVYRLGNW